MLQVLFNLGGKGYNSGVTRVDESGSFTADPEEIASDLAYLNASLHGITQPTLLRPGDHAPTILMYEICRDGATCYKSMRLRDLLKYVSAHVTTDEAIGDCAAGDLKLRDLRRLDYQFNPSEERAILVRRNVVLIALVGPQHHVPLPHRLNPPHFES
jgi:hypothetical protein